MWPLDKGSWLFTLAPSLPPPLSRTICFCSKVASCLFQTPHVTTSLLCPPQGQLTGHQEATLDSIQFTQALPLILFYISVPCL